MKRTKETRSLRLQLTATTAQLYELLVDGLSDAEIQKTLRVSSSELARLKETLVAEQAFEVTSEAPERTFANYRIEQRRNIKACDQLIEELDGNTQYNAVIGAIRLRADLIDRIVDTGQKLGVMKKAAQQHHHTGTLLVGQLSNDELRGAIKTLSGTMHEMVEKYGDKPFLALPAGEIYYGDAVKETFTTTGEVESSESDPKPSKVVAKSKKKPKGRQGLRVL